MSQSSADHLASSPTTLTGDAAAMKRLYHMSRTAGAGMHDYAAVNTFAVTACVLGVASFLSVALRHLDLLLLIPILGTILGVLGLVQIARSNRTQAGIGIAVLGLLLCIGCAGFIFRERIETRASQADSRREMQTLASDFARLAIEQKYDDAYALFHRRFRDRVTPEVFRGVLDRWRRGVIYGPPVRSAELGPRVIFESDPQNQTPLGIGLLNVNLDTGLDDRAPSQPSEQIRFERADSGQWLILDIPSYFPAEMSRRE
jgi:hypothetical protein